MKKFKLTKIKLNWANNQGFTLVELLLAMVLMTLVTTLAGSGLVALLQQNQKAEYETQRRTNLNRALDYIANNIRSASQIEIDSTTGKVTLTIPKLQENQDEEQFNYDPTQNETQVYLVADGTEVWKDKTVTMNDSVLVDGIKEPSNPPSCSGGGSGFYICSDDGNQVDIYLYGKLSDDPTDPDYKKTLEVKQTVFTRSTAYSSTLSD